MKFIRSYDELSNYILSTEDGKSSDTIDVLNLPQDSAKNLRMQDLWTPVASVKMRYFPQYEMNSIFCHEYEFSSYALAIKIRSDLTQGELGYIDVRRLKENLDQFDENKTIIYQPDNNNHRYYASSELLVGCKDIDVLLQKLENHPSILGKAPTVGIKLLHKKLPAFMNKTQAPAL